MLLNHTGCGFTTFTDDELNAKLSALTGDASPAPMRFFSYKDPEENTREQMKKVRSHPWIAKEVPVRGFIFDVETGLIMEVQQVSRHTAAWRTVAFPDRFRAATPPGAADSSSSRCVARTPGLARNDDLGRQLADYIMEEGD
jgi:hypothetical protein